MSKGISQTDTTQLALLNGMMSCLKGKCSSIRRLGVVFTGVSRAECAVKKAC